MNHKKAVYLLFFPKYAQISNFESNKKTKALFYHLEFWQLTHCFIVTFI